MRRGLRLAALTVFFAVALTSGLGACDAGGSSETAVQRATQILGHKPKGLARQVVTKNELIVVTAADYPPQSWVNDRGKLSGFDVEVAAEVAELLGVEVTYLTPEWDAAPSVLAGKTAHLSVGSLIPTEELKKRLAFTKPYYFMPARLAVSAGGQEVDGPAGLAGKTVGVGAQTSYFYWLRENTDAVIKTFAADADTFAELEAGRLDAIVAAGPTLAQAIRSGKPFKLSGGPLFSEGLAFAVHRGEADLLALMNHAIRQLRAEGSLSRLSREWFNDVDLSVKVP